MLELRIEDRALLGLIRKWLKAGILEAGGVIIHPVTGTPQGGLVSPVLANVYLHYALDLWFERGVKAHVKAERFRVEWVAVVRGIRRQSVHGALCG